MLRDGQKELDQFQGKTIALATETFYEDKNYGNFTCISIIFSDGSTAMLTPEHDCGEKSILVESYAALPVDEFGHEIRLEKDE